MSNIRSSIETISRRLDQAAGFCLVATMVLIMVNIILRLLFKSPILGTIDYVGILTALCIALGLAYCAWQNAQIAVEFVFDKLPSRMQGILGTLLNIIALVFWATVVWYLVVYGRDMAVSGMVSSTVNFPLAPVVYVIALGFVGLCLVLIVKTVDSIRKVIE